MLASPIIDVAEAREGYAMLRSVSDSVLCVWHVSGVGYTMRDIRYHWKDGLSSVGMSNEVQLPQFRVLGHRQRATVVTLTTGNNIANAAVPALSVHRFATDPVSRSPCADDRYRDTSTHAKHDTTIARRDARN
jgi:hypothetical protein